MITVLAVLGAWWTGLAAVLGLLALIQYAGERAQARRERLAAATEKLDPVPGYVPRLAPPVTKDGSAVRFVPGSDFDTLLRNLTRDDAQRARDAGW